MSAHRRKKRGLEPKNFFDLERCRKQGRRNLSLKKVPDADIIAHYHRLWNVEQAFRIAKSDLASRPVFHHKEASIRAHMLICVMALAVSKYIEIKTKRSIRSVLDVCRTITDALLVHRATGTKNIMRSRMPLEMQKIQELLSH